MLTECEFVHLNLQIRCLCRHSASQACDVAGVPGARSCRLCLGTSCVLHQGGLGMTLPSSQPRLLPSPLDVPHASRTEDGPVRARGHLSVLL